MNVKSLTATSLLSSALVFTTAHFAVAQPLEADTPANSQNQQVQKHSSYLVSADRIVFDENTQQVITEGDVEIVSEKGSIQADKITYNVETEDIVAEGNVLYLDENGIALFSRKLEMTGAFKTAVIDALTIRLQEGPKLTAKNAQKVSPTKYELNEPDYTACIQKEGCTLPWRIKAKQINLDTEEEIIRYKHARLFVKDVPILYVPHFFHTSNPEKRLSGILPPRFGQSSDRGFEINTAYYDNIAQNSDATYRAKLMTNRGLLLQAERRHEGVNLRGEVKGSFIQDSENNKLRSYIEGYTTYVLEPGKRFGVNGTLISDDTYLSDFYQRSSSYLPTTVYYEDADKNDYLSVSSTFYHDLRIEADSAQTGQILPEITYEKFYELGKAESLTLKTNFEAIHRQDGDKRQRIANSADWQKTHYTNDGALITMEAGVRADVYNIEPGDTSVSDKGTQTRFVPQAAVGWEKPFKNLSGNHVITPKVKLIAAPHGGNGDITNEDSKSFELDKTNLFLTQRFSGYDRMETGPRLIYGVDNYFGSSDQNMFRIFLGQSLRMRKDSEQLSSSNSNASEFIGLVSYNPDERLNLYSRFALDHNTYEMVRMDTSLVLRDYSKNYLELTHTHNSEGLKQLHMEGKYTLNPKYWVGAEIRRDLDNGGKQLEQSFTLGYTHNCYSLYFSAERRGYNNRDVPPSTNFMFNFELLSLGRDYED